MEAGVVEPIRNRNGEATDEWFGTLKPDTGNEYRVVKLVSPIVIYWEGETPRSIPGVYIVGNTGVKEIYSADGTLQINTGRDADVIEDQAVEYLADHHLYQLQYPIRMFLALEVELVSCFLS